jgi:hypothetical protein
MTKNRQIRFGTLIAGILTALVIVVSQLFYFEKFDHAKKEVKTEQPEGQGQSSDATDDGTYISLPSSTLPSSSTHVEFLQHSFCLFEIIFPEREVAVPDLGSSLSLSKFFQTLFHTLISPNAP